MENTHKTFLKGGSNVGSLTMVVLIIALVGFGSLSFYQGIKSGYNVTAGAVDATDNGTGYAEFVSLSDRMVSNSSASFANQSESATRGALGSASEVASQGLNVIGLGLGLVGSVISAISLVFSMTEILGLLVDMVVSVLHLPSFSVVIIKGAIIISVTLIVLGAITKWNLKDDTR